MFSIISTPYATPTHEVDLDAKVQSQQNHSTKDGLLKVQSDLGSEIESVPLSGIVFAKILVRTEILENPSQISSVLLQKSEKTISTTQQF